MKKNAYQQAKNTNHGILQQQMNNNGFAAGTQGAATTNLLGALINPEQRLPADDKSYNKSQRDHQY